MVLFVWVSLFMLFLPSSFLFSVLDIIPDRSPDGYVGDFAQVFSTSEKSSLEQLLTRFHRSSDFELAVVTVSSLEDNSIEEFSVALMEAWGIGKKNKDNGILITLAIQESRIRVEVGYGLEFILTDRKVANIIRSSMIPKFRKGGFAVGIMNGILSISELLSVDVGLKKQPVRKKRKSSPFIGVLFLILLGFLGFRHPFLLLLLLGMGRGGHFSSFDGGGFGGNSFGGFGGGLSGGGGASADW